LSRIGETISSACSQVARGFELRKTVMRAGAVALFEIKGSVLQFNDLRLRRCAHNGNSMFVSLLG
jgi:hypothetical protein